MPRRFTDYVTYSSADSTCRVWDVPPDVPSQVAESITCKHSSAQRKSEITQVVWNVSLLLLWPHSSDFGLTRKFFSLMVRCSRLAHKTALLASGRERFQRQPRPFSFMLLIAPISVSDLLETFIWFFPCIPTPCMRFGGTVTVRDC
jgi:hypothetical protein